MELRDPFPRPARNDDHNGASARLIVFRVFVVLVFVVLAGRLWQLQIVRGEQYRQRADSNRFRIEAIDAPRGVIYDRGGNIVVRNKASFAVSVVPANLPAEQEQHVYQKLADLLDMPVSGWPAGVGTGARPSIREIVEAGRARDPYSPVLVKANVPRDTALIIEETHLSLPGVRVETAPIREYTTGPLLSHILGYMGSIPKEWAEAYDSPDYHPADRVGLAGVEYSLEDVLRGEKGHQFVEVDVVGRILRMIGDPIEPVPGHNLYLTIDTQLQRDVEGILKGALEELGASSGAAVVGDPGSGEIMAMVSLPRYDNGLFAGGISADDWEELANAPLNPLLNRAIAGLYPPGSIFKLVPAAAALEEGVVTPDTLIDDPGVILVKNEYFPDDPEMAQPFYCWLRSGHGKLDVVGAIAHSCDVFFYEIAGGFEDFRGLGVDRLAQYAELFGLGAPTGIDLPGELAGLVPTPKWKRKRFGADGGVWTTGNTYNMGIGQGDVLVTPLQMFSLTSVVASGGTLYRPQIIQRVVDTQGETVERMEPEVTREVAVDPAHLALVRQGMRRAVTSGTAKAEWTHLPPEIDVAGKTGTAEFCQPNAAGTDCERDSDGNLLTHAWFVAFAPFEAPEIAVVVFIDGRGVGHVIEGSRVAAPIAADIIRTYYGLPEWQPTPTPGPQ
ncbi:MAG: Peptidoglycan D,D-transpeptidase MrdA [Anaerolineales bacterium]|nr:Peptidoglycan D,D-transpeptidase MrdA [Anaerolineales bacterium]